MSAREVKKMWFVMDDREASVEHYEYAYKTQDQAVKAAWDEWEHLTRSERRGVVIQVAERSAVMDEDGKWVPVEEWDEEYDPSMEGYESVLVINEEIVNRRHVVYADTTNGVTEVEGAWCVPDEAEDMDDWMFMDKLPTLCDDEVIWAEFREDELWVKLLNEYGVRSSK